METISIKIGQRYFCLLKTTIVDENQLEDMEFVHHIASGIVKVKGIMQDPENKQQVIPFVEVCNQRIRASHVFETHEECMEFAVELSKARQIEQINKFHLGGEAIPKAE